jgi:ribosomal-protein-serine acetyltransferase
MSIQVDDKISLEFLEEIHAASLFNLINNNRAYLKEWLPWVDSMRTVENAGNYIGNCIRQAAERTDFAYAIMVIWWVGSGCIISTSIIK